MSTDAFLLATSDSPDAGDAAVGDSSAGESAWVEIHRFPAATELREWVRESPTAAALPDALVERVVRTVAGLPATAETIVAAVVTSAHAIANTGSECEIIVRDHGRALAAALLDEPEWTRLLDSYPGFGATPVDN
jgi:hypothetical protein